MKINSLNSVSFGRHLRGEEIKDCNSAINDSLKALKKEVGIILHNSSAPSDKEFDTGIGSVYSEASRNLVLPFLVNNGFTSIQVEPETERKFGDPSPYVSSTNAMNSLNGDLEQYTTEKYGKLLSRETFDSIVEKNPNKGLSRTNFDYVHSQYNKAYSEIWENFKAKKEANSPEIASLSAEFEDFKSNLSDDVKIGALYKAFSIENGSDYWKNWESDSDKNLFTQPKDVQEKRTAEIKEKYSDEIEKFYFTQMLVSKVKNEAVDEYRKNGIKIIGDVPVAFSDADAWSRQDIFLSDYKMGCPPEPGNSEGQAWDFPVLNPKKIFNPDGSLGEGGKYLYNKYQKLFKENTGGVRIDHAVGLIDPFVYKDKPSGHDAGRLYSTQSGELSQFYKHDRNSLGDIFKKIIIPAAKDAGLSKNDIICEDLGIVPQYIKDTFKNIGLRGISITQYVNNNKIPSGNIAMIGCHDNPTLIEYTNNLFAQGDPYNHTAWKLTEDVLPKDASHDTKQDYFDDMRFDYNRPGAKNKFNTSKFAQLFTSPSSKVQIFWEDVIGREERYNKPSTNKGNWELRLAPDFEEEYNKKLQNNEALNMPEVLGIALRECGVRGGALIEKLDKYAKILKEKE